MKIFAVAVISVAFMSCPLAFGETEHYKMAIQEKGTPFSEDIDIDEKQDVEVFRVPAHNDVEGADFYHDFKLRLTVTRLLSQKACYISEIKSSLSSPGKLKMDLDRAASLHTQRPVETNSHLVAVTGPANRLVLTKEILDFCGTLPIYNTEIIEGADNGNGTINYQVDRQKRTIVQNFISCSTNVDVVNQCPFAKWNLSCRMKTSSCFYYVTCHNMQPRASQWNCSTTHLSNAYPICCDLVCP